MHKCMVLAPVPSDGTSTARAWGILPLMKKKADIDFIRAEGSIDWSHVAAVDSVFLQRSFMPAQVQLARLARDLGKPVIVDYDDDLFCVPKDNPTHPTYSQAWAQENIRQSCQMASVVMASTEVLADKLRPFNPNVRVVPNALNLDLLKPLPQELSRNPIVVWRGSHTHVRDIQEHTPAIMEAYEKFPNFSFFFVGYDPWWITEKMAPERCQTVPFDGSYVNFMRNMAKIRGAIQIVPLADSPFNRAKSNIAFLEGSFAGSVVLGPDFPEWKQTPCVQYTGPDGFRNQLFELMATPFDKLAAQAAVGYDWVQRYRNLNLMTELRIDIFRQFAGL